MVRTPKTSTKKSAPKSANKKNSPSLSPKNQISPKTKAISKNQKIPEELKYAKTSTSEEPKLGYVPLDMYYKMRDTQVKLKKNPKFKELAANLTLRIWNDQRFQKRAADAMLLIAKPFYSELLGNHEFNRESPKFRDPLEEVADWKLSPEDRDALVGLIEWGKD